MNIRGAPDLGQPSDDPSSGGQRERIRQRMKMVIGQLEGILQELKEVAKELREVSEGPDSPPDQFSWAWPKKHTYVFPFVCVCTQSCMHTCHFAGYFLFLVLLSPKSALLGTSAYSRTSGALR